MFFPVYNKIFFLIFSHPFSGVHFNTTHEKLLEEIESAVTIFGHGLELLVNTNNESNVLNLNSAINCNSTDNIKWKTGEHLF